MEKLYFKKLSDAAQLPTRAHATDGGLDLYATEEAAIKPLGHQDVGTGLAVAIPEGKAGLIVPRSGLAAKHGVSVVNAPGLIDAGYRGELRVILHNTDDRRTFKVEIGDRIAQLVIVAVGLEVPQLVDELPEPSDSRGAGGFGSTGAN